jgi:hypothetical protein
VRSRVPAAAGPTLVRGGQVATMGGFEAGRTSVHAVAGECASGQW